MNVAFDAWIPVVTISGERRLASLCEVLTEGEMFLDLAVRPHERVALMRLFLCTAHATLDGPKDYTEWCEVPKRLSTEARIYLTKWRDSFELFHEKRPWLQVAEISKNDKGEGVSVHGGDWTPVAKLNFSLATGAASTLFDHSGIDKDRDIAIEETVLSMLSFQCFSPGGLISQVFWNGIQSGKSSKDAPCVSASMIHAFLKGENLLRTICLNLPFDEDIRICY
ncbi:MAG: type I-E CRISPR-associated protein Cse1/CasA, partial [Candidatus Omnitrophota bacterium]